VDLGTARSRSASLVYYEAKECTIRRGVGSIHTVSVKASILALSVLMALAVTGGKAAALAASPAVAAAVVRRDELPVATVEFPDGVLAIPDVEYADFIGFRPLLLDLYRQGGAVTGRRQPLVIYVHGGGWRRGDSRTLGAFADFPAVLAALAAHGYVVAAVNYRLSGEAHFPAAVRDLNAAIEFLRAHAGEYGIDPARIVLWGASAGAQLAALSATSCGDPRFAPPAATGRLSRRQAAAAVAPHTSDCAQAVVAWYGLYDLAPLANGVGDAPAIAADVRTFLGCGNGSCTRLLREASPITHVSPRAPRMLLIDGTGDTEVPDAQTQEMAAALRRAHVPVEAHFIRGANHGLIEHTASGTRQASLAALRRTFRFIDTVTASGSLPSR
jgi:acetyl esterase/lipase